MPELALCPYCHGNHRKKSAFLKCQKSHTILKWQPDGSKKRVQRK